VQQSRALLTHYQLLDGKQLYAPTLAADFDQHQLLAIGTPAPAFRLPSAAGDTLSLGSWHGKLVYLNFWKSTSGPCLYDLSHLQALQKQFAGRDIVFVSINLDDKEESWQQQLAQKQLPGVQLWAASGYQSAAAAAYGVQTIPAYVLVGEDGTIVNPKPKRPSSRAVAAELNQAVGRAARYRAFSLPPLPPVAKPRPATEAGPTAGLRP